MTAAENINNVEQSLDQRRGVIQQSVDQSLSMLRSRGVSEFSLSAQSHTFVRNLRNFDINSENAEDRLNDLRDAYEVFKDEVLRLMQNAARSIAANQNRTRDNIGGIINGWPFNTSEPFMDAANTGFMLRSTGVMGGQAEASFVNTMNVIAEGKFQRERDTQALKTRLNQERKYIYLHALTKQEQIEATIQNLEAQKRRYMMFQEDPGSIESNQAMQTELAQLEDDLARLNNQAPEELDTDAYIQQKRIYDGARDELGNEQGKSLAEFMRDFSIDDRPDIQPEDKTDLQSFYENFSLQKEEGGNKSDAEIQQEVQDKLDTYDGYDGATVADSLVQKVKRYCWAKRRDAAHVAMGELTQSAQQEQIAEKENQIAQLRSQVSTVNGRNILHNEDINFSQGVLRQNPDQLNSFTSTRLSAINAQLEAEHKRLQEVENTLRVERLADSNSAIGLGVAATRFSMNNLIKPLWGSTVLPLTKYYLGHRAAEANYVGDKIANFAEWRSKRFERKAEQEEAKTRIMKAKTDQQKAKSDRSQYTMTGKAFATLGNTIGFGARTVGNVAVSPLNLVSKTAGVGAAAVDGVGNLIAKPIAGDNVFHLSDKVGKTFWFEKKKPANDTKSDKKDEAA